MSDELPDPKDIPSFRQLICLCWWHKTKILGVLQGCLATLLGTGIIPESHAKYYIAAVAVLTFLCGYLNSKPKETT